MTMPRKIEVDKVKSLSTKFYYKEGKLCFQIILIYGEEKMILFRDFDDYREYQSNHDNLIHAINEHKDLPVDFMSVVNSNYTMTYRA